jgi:hypothetical protein
LAARSRRRSNCSKSRVTPFGFPMTQDYHPAREMSLYYTRISSFLWWALLTEYVLWFKLSLVSLPIGLVVWFFWSAFTSEWMESEFFICADYNPNDQRIYFISTQEALVDDNPPAPPGRVKATMWLEKINLDGSDRVKLVKLPTTDQLDVEGFPRGGRRYYMTNRSLRLKISPSHEKIAIEEYWGSVFVIDLRDNGVTTLLSRGGSSTNDLKYESGRPLVSWLPDNEHLLLLVQRHRLVEKVEDIRVRRLNQSPDYRTLLRTNDVTEDVIVSTPITEFQPNVVWVSTNTWAGPIGSGLLMKEQDGCKLVSLDLNTLTPGTRHATPLNLCWDTIPSLQSNTWLTSEGEIVDGEIRVLRKLPNLKWSVRCIETEPERLVQVRHHHHGSDGWFTGSQSGNW